jgi:hypothetical protein
VDLAPVVVWSRATTGASLLSRRDTGITGFPLWRLESQVDEG